MYETTLGKVTLGKVPEVVAIIDKLYSVEAVRSFKAKGASMLEIRADCIAEDFQKVVAYAERLRKAVDMPLIGTIRETEKNRKKRLSMFEALLPFMDACDIEIDTPINRELIKMASGKKIIISEHDFTRTPENDDLNKIVNRAKALGADIIKIAAMAHDAEDVARLMCFTAARSENMVSIAMGEFGAISRIIAPLFGSLFTYVFIDKAVAPGQIALEELVKELKKYYPGFNESKQQR